MRTNLETVLFGLAAIITTACCSTPTKDISTASTDSGIKICTKAPLSLAGKSINGRVKNVVDGDTITLSDGTKVRFVGVDTPETKHPRKPVEPFGKEASNFTHAQLNGEEVELVLDQNSAATNHRDHFGRLLAYVFRKRDGFDVSAELITQGYAHAFTKYPFERMAEFRCLQTKARDTKQGLWRDAPSGK